MQAAVNGYSVLYEPEAIAERIKEVIHTRRIWEKGQRKGLKLIFPPKSAKGNFYKSLRHLSIKNLFMLKTIKKIERVFIVPILILIGFSACSLWTNRKIEIPQGYISSNGLLTIKDRPFFPIGIYSVNPPSAFKEIKEAGFNTVHTYEFRHDYLKTYIDHAEKLGLKVLVFPGDRIEMPKFNIQNVKETVKSHKESSTVLAWYLSDEPDGGISPERVKDIKELIHELDPFHPTSVVIANRRKVKDYAETADIIMVDPYPVPRKPLIDVAQAVDMARKAVGDKKPVWAVLQAFGYQNEKNKGWGWKREPTYQEMRAMTYLAIAQGAKGIFYYTYHGSQYFIKESPRHWENLKAIVGELTLIYPLLISPEIEDFELSVTTTPTSNQSPLLWTVRKVSEESLYIKAGTYLIVVNSANHSVMATFWLKQIQSNDIKVIFENRKLVSTNGNFSDSFAPYEVHIYNFQ